MLKFISLLGTNAYLPCNYYLDDIKAEDCCYIQEALIRILTKKGMEFDNVLVFTTQEAYLKNWVDNAYNKRYNEQRPGLEMVLKDVFKDCPDKVKNVFIPSGNSEEELWKLFDILLAQIDEGDEIILDITHSFRFLPMLAFIVFSFARIVKRCEIKGIYYGAFEVLGSTKEVEAMDISVRNAPVFDLTPFVVLFDWILGIDRYIATGDASIVERLTRSESGKLSRRIRQDISEGKLPANPASLFRNSNLLRDLSRAMIEFGNTIFTCRGQELSEAALKLKKAINDVVESDAYHYVKPLAYIMDMLKNRFDRFGQDEYVNMLEAVRWCLENNMYQQGLTILEEGLISFACDMYGVDKKEKENRQGYSGYYKEIQEGTATVRLFDGLDLNATEEFYKLLYNLGNIRNDINHAGWAKHYSRPVTFKEKLEEFIVKAEDILRSRTSERQMLLVFSHQLTDAQQRQAKEKLGISRFVPLSPELLNKWSNVPPELDKLDDYLKDVLKWIDHNARGGDYVLVQGDYGATMIVVAHCLKRNLRPVYATTRRVVSEEKEGGKVLTTREFEHVEFREYKLF
nr:MAG: TIGR02221 family CRISPR-associated protein [Caldicoprobacter oshimai]